MSKFMPDFDMDDPAVQASMRDFTVPVAMLDELRKAGRHARQAVSHIQVPLLVLQGWQDELVPARQTRRFLRDYAGPIHYLELPAAHDLADATRPAWPHVTAAVTRFLTELAP